MDSALSPKEIQGRIRAGESLAEVAEAAGVPEDKIAPFAGPVLAEREHIASVSRTGLVRKRGDGPAQRSLTKVIAERMTARRLDPDELAWDAFRLPDRTWRVVATLDHASVQREAWFTYDARGRFNVAVNADARWLIGEDPLPGEESENTVDLNDELALVRATSEAPPVLPPPTPIRPGVTVADDDLDLDLGDDYQTAEFAEVDGLYDIVAPQQSQLDVLYEMLSGISEDSVRIYAGLEDDAPAELGDEAIEAIESEEGETGEPLAEPEQDALIETPPAAKPKPKGRKRASVPAWDDILFGGPPRKK